jgi:hypothetical protein
MCTVIPVRLLTTRDKEYSFFSVMVAGTQPVFLFASCILRSHAVHSIHASESGHEGVTIFHYTVSDRAAVCYSDGTIPSASMRAGI